MGLDIVELVMTVEETFGIEIPDRDAERLRTVGDLYWYVREHGQGRPVLSAGSPEAAPAGELWERLLDIIERQTGLDRGQLTPAARFVDDLGLD